MKGRPEVLREGRTGRKKVSVVLIDWGVRESFHGPEYLNQQTLHRDDYELIWVEFYDRKPEPVRKLAAAGALDKWIVLGYPNDTIYHKHRAYNAGLLAATGDVCVVCDSDAIFRPTFMASIVRAFEETPYAVVHLDQVRNSDRRFYPFNYPTIEDVMGAGCMNWWEHTTGGLYTEIDRLHRANYGACMAARRSELLRIGGSDEHLEYLGFCCGPYEMTFRLQNRGRRERWLSTEYLYHTWHPNTTMGNADYQSPHDGRFLPLRALHARASGRVQPYRANPAVAADDFAGFLKHVAEVPEPDWAPGAQPAGTPDFLYHVDRNDRGFAVFVYRDEWFAIPAREGPLDLAKAAAGQYPLLLTGANEDAVRLQIDYLSGGDRTPRPSGRWERFRRDLLGEPLHQLPRRMWRKVLKRLVK